MALKKSTLSFLGFGGKKAEDTKADDDATRRAQAEQAAKTDDEDEEDEDGEEGESEDDREARVARNALRAAGERRGRRVERERITAIMNGVAPAKAEFALHLALGTDLTADQAKAAIDKAPKGAGADFIAAMSTTQTPTPDFGGAPQGRGPNIVEMMKGDLKRRGLIS